MRSSCCKPHRSIYAKVVREPSISAKERCVHQQLVTMATRYQRSLMCQQTLFVGLFCADPFVLIFEL